MDQFIIYELGNNYCLLEEQYLQQLFHKKEMKREGLITFQIQ